MLTSVKMMSGRQSPSMESRRSTSAAVRTSYPARRSTPATKCRLISLSSISRILYGAAVNAVTITRHRWLDLGDEPALQTTLLTEHLANELSRPCEVGDLAPTPYHLACNE